MLAVIFPLAISTLSLSASVRAAVPAAAVETSCAEVRLAGSRLAWDIVRTVLSSVLGYRLFRLRVVLAAFTVGTALLMLRL